MASRVTPAAKEEGVDVKEAEEEGGIAEVVGSVVSTRGCFSRN